MKKIRGLPLAHKKKKKNGLLKKEVIKHLKEDMQDFDKEKKQDKVLIKKLNRKKNKK